jgi:hypothetical protein
MFTFRAELTHLFQDAVSPDPTSDSHAAMSMITNIVNNFYGHVEMSSIYDERADEQGENIHLIGAQCAQHHGIKSELTFSTSGRMYTRFLQVRPE